ncbi:alpha-amylase family protein [Paenibacillus ginsengarvi]|uniref:Glycoside hydrolase n=1 Tax=Paenibacillus ginsengarvi TaxID=400777 RepID=A0A3B0CKY3_9BACL|nr:alpha-amylase family protein [Paenibacillus ginsengarvi]RKN85184.1 glycoside hydrolase [Paenibacillus ginsengarvi]
MNRTIVFYDPLFPIASDRPDAALLDRLAASATITDGEALAELLLSTQGGCFVNLHAPYFPKDAWTAILDYLQRGGGLVSAGGAPFRFPVYRSEAGWTCESEQTAYHRQLLIHEAMQVDPAPIESLAALDEIPLFAPYTGLLTVEPTYSLVMHVTRSSDIPHESGSAGPMDARLYPLVKGISPDKREVAAPVVLIEHAKGTFAGARWLFVNQRLTSQFWSQDGAAAFRALADFCSRGVTEMWLLPLYASYDPGDRAKFRFQLQQLGGAASTDAETNESWSCTFRFGKQTADGSEAEWTHTFDVAGSRELTMLPVTVPAGLEAGLYTAQLTAVSDKGEVRLLRQAVWGFDRELLAQGEALTCDRDYFRKNGKPLPIVGMTYMTSDVARKFIFMPNVSVWDRDMAEMKRAGINMIRTGIWTGYRHVMYEDGHPSEEVLRAIDAFILTCKRHELEVTFNFFAFTPELWEGTNPYIDPRSVAAQKRLIAAVVSRHRETANVHWDLINEPSMFDPKRIFEGPRSSRDSFEKKAYIDWLKSRYGSIRELQTRWGYTPAELPSFEAVSPPEPGEINFDIQDMHSGKKGTRWLDYSLFGMEMLNRWTAELSETIRAIAPGQLITVGQDEALGAQRPSPLLYESSVDYTTNHSWWLMDQLVWDGIFTKTPYKPNLIQETGIMYVETPDGRAKRSETELRNILERKYAYSFSTGGAGAVQWLWHTNMYMNNVNESNIGALRADGTQKPEADVSYDFGKFMGDIGHLFEGRALEDVVVVFPYSNDLSNRRLAVEATSALTRVLCYELNVHFRAMSEYELSALADQPPKLIVVPSAHNFSDGALETLLGHVREHGGTLLLTGPAGLDEHWRPVERLTEQLGTRRLANVLREEELVIGGKALPLSYGARKIAQLCKEVACAGSVAGGAAGDEPHGLTEARIGKGKLLWTGLPVELNDRAESMRALYAHVLAECGARSELVWEQGGDLAGVYGRKLAFRDGSLFVFVSEYGRGAAIRVKDPATERVYEFALPSERSVMFATDREGGLVAVYRPDEVAVEVR